ncbi:MAG: dTDP-4-dehydrorhamnose reductase [Myxococcaceae bacterium]
MRFVVTGANGLVGSRLCTLLASRGHEVVGLSRGPRRAEGNFAYASVDLTNGEQIARALKEARPEVVINPAASTDVDGCEKDPASAFAVNVDAVHHLARTSKELGAHLVHVSTDYVYDGDHGPYTEGDLPNPRGNYAITKFAGELAARIHLPNCTIARTAVVYGWPQAAKPNFGSWVVTTLSSGQTIKLFEDQFVSPSLADNVAEMLAELGERKLPGLFHTAGSDVVDRVTFGRAVCELFGFDPKLITPTKLKDLKLASPRPLHSGLNVSKARETLAAKPLPLSEALKRFHSAWKRSQGEKS